MANVAGPAALLVAKLYKIGERADSAPGRLVDKDAHDLYRLLVAIDTAALAEGLGMLRAHDLAGPGTEKALEWLRDLFAAGPDARGSQMAARAEAFGTAAKVAAACAVLAKDVLDTLNWVCPYSGRTARTCRCPGVHPTAWAIGLRHSAAARSLPRCSKDRRTHSAQTSSLDWSRKSWVTPWLLLGITAFTGQ